MRAVAVLRVLAWHTWGWIPLTWIGAMPAMFLANGALLAPSLARHGWWRTVVRRVRRLLIPYWVYATCCVAIMVAAGWRPGPGDLVRWAVPVLDPGGKAGFAALWIPLWYLRAYLWFVLASGLFHRLTRVGWIGPLVVGVAALGIAPSLPLPLGDFLTYGTFVLAGMMVAERGLPRSRQLRVGLGLVAAPVAVATFTVLVATGRIPALANETYAGTMLIGIATVVAVMAAPGVLRSLASGPTGPAVAWIGSRSLSIYLWQGLGLLVAQRLVWARDWNGLIEAAMAGIVVAGVTLGAVGAVGWLEDLAAGRSLVAPRILVRTALAAGVAALLVAVQGGWITPTAPRAANGWAPITGSGAAVLANAGRVERSLRPRRRPTLNSTTTTLLPPPVATAPDLTSQDAAVTDVVERFVALHRGDLTDWSIAGIELDVATRAGDTVVRWSPGTGVEVLPAGAPLDGFAWYSMTKAATTGWMMELVDLGEVALDDSVAKYLPEIPHGDEITLAMLARHQSGIGRRWDTEHTESAVRGETVRRWIDAGGPLEFAPGSGYQYSGVGYGILAWALERASGRSWRDGLTDVIVAANANAVFDEDNYPVDVPSQHPGEGSYRGRLWADSGLGGSVRDGARLYQTLFSVLVSPEALDAVFGFAPSARLNYYGLGIVPVCPCTRGTDGGVATDFGGHQSATGGWVFDRVGGNAVMYTGAGFWARGMAAPLWDELATKVLTAVR